MNFSGRPSGQKKTNQCAAAKSLGCTKAGLTREGLPNCLFCDRLDSMKKTPPSDAAISRAREVFAASGKTLDELGVAMGYETGVARKSAWQFLNKTTDPRLSMLRRFAKAVGVSVEELVREGK
jgi:hypothetical protein